jgi:hypothetical protein
MILRQRANLGSKVGAWIPNLHQYFSSSFSSRVFGGLLFVLSNVLIIRKEIAKI